MKKLFRFNAVVAMILVLCFTVSFAAYAEVNISTSNGFFSVSLDSLSDEELAAVAEAIRTEQRARIKTRIILDSAEIIINVGKSQKIGTQIVDLPESEKVPKLEWSSSDKNIATCNNGTVKAVSAGKTTVICSAVLSDGMEIIAECSVTVTVPVSAITTEKKTITLDVTKSCTPSIVVKPDNATDKKLIYSSSDSSVASVDSQGKITGKSQGKAVISISTADNSGKTISVTVNVEDNRSSIGKKTAKISGAYAKEMCEYISYEFTSFSNIVNSKRNAAAITESMLAFMEAYEKGYKADISKSANTVYIGVSKEDKRKMYLACLDIYGQYWMVEFEPDQNNITYSKETKNPDDALAFMEYNCNPYSAVTGKQFAK